MLPTVFVLCAGTGTGPGVWTGQGVTRTKRNRTLFVTMVRHVELALPSYYRAQHACVGQLPGGVEPAQIGSLFKDEPGFEGFRNRRRMCFVDFKTPIYGMVARRTHVCVRVPVFMTLRPLLCQPRVRCASSKATSSLTRTRAWRSTMTRITYPSGTSSTNGRSASATYVAVGCGCRGTVDSPTARAGERADVVLLLHLLRLQIPQP